jgi:hypothetical protein
VGAAQVMEQARSQPAPRPRTVFIVGNSNSIMNSSYARRLQAIDSLNVVNLSIGDSPNVILLDFLANARVGDEDVVIVETSVMDVQLDRMGTFPRSETIRTLHVFLTALREMSRARVVLLVLPVRSLLAEHRPVWVEEAAFRAAAFYGAEVFDVYNLLRGLLPPGWRGPPDTAKRCIADLFAAVGLPTHEWSSYLWLSGFRRAGLDIGPVLRGAFQDELHISAVIHAMAGDILAQWLKSLPERDNGAERAAPDSQRVRSIVPDFAACRGIVRTSRLLTREFAQLDPAGPVTYRVPPHCRAVALVVNRSKTHGVLSLTGSACTACYDLRLLQSRAGDFTAGLLPLRQDVGTGEVVARMSADADHPGGASRFWEIEAPGKAAQAELAGLVVIERGWEAAAELDLPDGAGGAAGGIEASDWVRTCSADLLAAAGLGAASVEAASAAGLPSLMRRAIQAVGGVAEDAPAIDRARLFIALGDLRAARLALETQVTAQPEDRKSSLILKRLIETEHMLQRG